MYDEVILEFTNSTARVAVPGFSSLETQDNLALKAVKALEMTSKQRLPVKITLHKRIPVGAGLGGGSSDAAAVLLGVRELFGLSLGTEELRLIARKLGADVPFFLQGGSAVGEGIGDVLTPVELVTDYSLVLINPGFPVETRTVYQAFSGTLTEMSRKSMVWEMLRNCQVPHGILVNDLQAAAEMMYPQIRDVRRALENAGVRYTLMSGSGATVFGIVPSDWSAKKLEGLPQGWKVWGVRPWPGGCIWE